MKVFWIDLFAGAGGTSTGIEKANANAEVIACVNHDFNAIAAHKSNHPNCKHFTEDIRDFAVVLKLKVIVEELRLKYPGCIINIWASLECTNYSKAKGGLPRDGDSRTLAEHLFMYLEELNPDYLYIENVREFMAWGPLDKKGKPLSRLNGRDYLRWIKKVKSYGFNHEYKILNSADFGAVQARERYFGIFGRKGLPISFPEKTHYDPRKKKPDGLFDFDLKPWRAVKEVLDLEVEGKSIFTRKKELSENTLKRIYAGLIKFVAKGEEKFIKRYNGGDPKQKVRSLDLPIGTISTNGRHAVVSTAFLKKYYSGRPKGKVTSIERPSGVITTVCNQALVQAKFLTSYYGNGQAHDVGLPSPTVTCKDRFAVHHLIYDYSRFTASSINMPAYTLTTNPKHNLISYNWLTDTQFGRVGQSLEKPCFTLIARMDKKPPYLIQTQSGELKIRINLDDNETMVKIKEFMAIYGIYDIKMRMLMIPELKQIQGFPKEYILHGTQTDQKKQIGNAVEVHQATALTNANYEALIGLQLPSSKCNKNRPFVKHLGDVRELFFEINPYWCRYFLERFDKVQNLDQWNFYKKEATWDKIEFDKKIHQSKLDGFVSFQKDEEVIYSAIRSTVNFDFEFENGIEIVSGKSIDKENSKYYFSIKVKKSSHSIQDIS